MKFLSGYEKMLHSEDAISASSPNSLYLYPTYSHFPSLAPNLVIALHGRHKKTACCAAG